MPYLRQSPPFPRSVFERVRRRRRKRCPLSQLTQDLSYSLRGLGANPGFACVAILTLALGIGANTAIFSFVDGVLLKPLPYPESDRIMRVMGKPPRGERNGISTLNYLDWERDNTVFEYMAAQTGGGATLGGSGDPVQLRGGRVSPDYFQIFGVNAADHQIEYQRFGYFEIRKFLRDRRIEGGMNRGVTGDHDLSTFLSGVLSAEMRVEFKRLRDGGAGG